MSVRVRVAPSPTGDPHVGTAYIALMNHCFARRHEGQFILRIEDTDQSRCSPQAAEAIFAALRWLGLDYDEGPDVGGDHGPYVQSQRVAAGIYQPHVERLLDQGDAYRCFCTSERLADLRAQQQAAKQAIMYDRHCRDLDPAEAASRAAAGEPHVIRMKTPLEGDCTFTDRLRPHPITKAWAEIDDQVLIKSDGWPTYHLAAVVDDHLMGITHVIRAEEWLNSVPKHLWLYQHLGWTAPEMIHVGLLRNADRSKISKRKNPVSLLHYQRRGYLPEAFVNFLALIGHSHPDEREVFDLAEMIRIFDLDRLSVGGPVFDTDRLDHLQGLYFRALDDDHRRAEIHRAIDARLDELLPLLRERMVFGGDITFLADFLFARSVSPHRDDLIPKKWDAARARAALEAVLKALRQQAKQQPEVWDATALEELLRHQAEALGCPAKDLFMIIRVAIAGRPVSPPLFDCLVILGRVAVSERLQQAALRLR